MNDDITYSLGFAETLRADAAVLYDQAFGAKIALAIPNRDERTSLLKECLLPNFAFVALMNNELVGLAGFHTPYGSLTGGVTGKAPIGSDANGPSAIQVATIAQPEERPRPK